nr:uncharacterized protein LOC123773885 [Procambarus clarkii]
MWSPVVILLLVASVRGEADADPEPILPPGYPQYATTWAAQQFGTPQEIAAAGAFISQRQVDPLQSTNFGFLPAQAAPSPLFAVRNVQARPSSLVSKGKPEEKHDVQVLRHPAFWFVPPTPIFLHSIHVRVPDSSLQQHVPVAAPSALSFASQHDAQTPVIRQGAGSTYLNFYPYPVATPGYAFTRQAVDVPSVAVASNDDADESAEDDSRRNYVILRHFPTELASLGLSLRGIDNEAVIPAGIVQSTQPSFTRVVFRNDKAHPSLHDKEPATDGAVLAV